MIKIKNIKIPTNYVLIRPDENFDTYQLKGSETNIIAPEYSYQKDKRIATPSKNFSVTGTVLGVPERIQFNRAAIKAINDSYTLVQKVGDQQRIVNAPMMRKIHDLKKESCRFETDNELQAGDRVKFSYMAHLTASENKRIFQTDQGKVYFIKYDDIFMTVDENKQPKKMINGYILIDPDVLQNKKEGTMEYVESDSGLVLPILKENSKHRRGMKCMEGKVLIAGRALECEGRPGGYFDIDGYNEIPIEVNPGDRVLFDPRIAEQLEHDNHQAMSDHKLYMIQRKDILLMEKDNVGIFEEIGVDKVNYDLV